MQHGRRHPDGFRVRISRRVPVRRRSPGWRGTVLAIAGDGAEFGVVRGDQLEGRRGAGVATAGPVRLSDLSGPRAGSRSRALRDAFTWICAALAGRGRRALRARRLERHGRTGPSGVRPALIPGIAAHKVPEGLALGAIAPGAMASRWAALGWCAAAQAATLGGAGLEFVFAPFLGMQGLHALLAIAGLSVLRLFVH